MNSLTTVAAELGGAPVAIAQYGVRVVDGDVAVRACEVRAERFAALGRPTVVALALDFAGVGDGSIAVGAADAVAVFRSIVDSVHTRCTEKDHMNRCEARRKCGSTEDPSRISYPSNGERNCLSCRGTNSSFLRFRRDEPRLFLSGNNVHSIPLSFCSSGGCGSPAKSRNYVPSLKYINAIYCAYVYQRRRVYYKGAMRATIDIAAFVPNGFRMTHLVNPQLRQKSAKKKSCMTIVVYLGRGIFHPVCSYVFLLISLFG